MPFQIIHSDVWGPAPISVGGYKYYISFIDNFTKFTWIYLMVDRTEAQHIFLQFQNMLSDSLTPKFNVVSPIGVGNTRNFTINFLFHLALLIVSLVPTLTNKMGPPNENTVTLLRRVLLY